MAFYSFASDLVAGDTNGAVDVFVRDRLAGTTRRVSVGVGGRRANRASLNPAISADGRHIAFGSEATNLVAGYTNGTWDVFVRDEFGDATTPRRTTPRADRIGADHQQAGGKEYGVSPPPLPSRPAVVPQR